MDILKIEMVVLKGIRIVFQQVIRNNFSHSLPHLILYLKQDPFSSIEISHPPPIRNINHLHTTFQLSTESISQMTTLQRRKSMLDEVLTESKISAAEISQSLDSNNNPTATVTAKLMHILTTFIQEKEEYQTNVELEISEIRRGYECIIQSKDQEIQQLKKFLADVSQKYEDIEAEHRAMEEYIVRIRAQMENAQLVYRANEILPTPPLKTQEEENFSNNLRKRLQLIIDNSRASSKTAEEVLIQLECHSNKAMSQKPQLKKDNTQHLFRPFQNFDRVLSKDYTIRRKNENYNPEEYSASTKKTQTTKTGLASSSKLSSYENEGIQCKYNLSGTLHRQSTQGSHRLRLGSPTNKYASRRLEFQLAEDRFAKHKRQNSSITNNTLSSYDQYVRNYLKQIRAMQR